MPTTVNRPQGQSAATDPRAAAIDRDIHVVVTTDGQRLGARVVEPIGARRGIAIALNAMMVDHRTFRASRDGLPGVLAAHGIEVRLPDFRGRGLSPADSFRYDDLVERDIPALVADAQKEGVPVTLIGHSLGGHTGIAAAQAGPQPDRIVLLAANIWRPSLEPNLLRRAAKAAALRAFTLASRPGRFPARRLRMGPVDEPRAYVDDLVSYWTLDRWASAGGRDWTAGMASLRIPVLSILGARDLLLGHPTAAANWARPLPRLSIEIAGRRSGLPDDPGHMELVTDPRSAPLWERIARFVAT